MSIAVRAERLSMSEFKETFLIPLKRARNELEKSYIRRGCSAPRCPCCYRSASSTVEVGTTRKSQLSKEFWQNHSAP
jgi:transposase-like protein